jgi:SH3-like domain-containing protein
MPTQRGASRSPRHLGLLTLVMLAAWLLPSTAMAEMLSVAVQEANFRAGPSKKHEVVFTAIQHYPVKVVGRKGGWVHVEDYEGDQAWVAARLLSKEKTAIVKVDRANLREKATIQSKVVGKVELAEVFIVKERKALWLHLFVGDEERGWIRKDLVWGPEK